MKSFSDFLTCFSSESVPVEIQLSQCTSNHQQKLIRKQSVLISKTNLVDSAVARDYPHSSVNLLFERSKIFNFLSASIKRIAPLTPIFVLSRLSLES